MSLKDTEDYEHFVVGPCSICHGHLRYILDSDYQKKTHHVFDSAAAEL